MRRIPQATYRLQFSAAFPLAPYMGFDPARDLGRRGVHRGY